MGKNYEKMSPAEKQAADWERKNLCEDYGYLFPERKPENLPSLVTRLSSVYAAFKVSPRAMMKYGRKYRTVEGALIKKKMLNGKPYPVVEWEHQGVIREGRATPGLHMLTSVNKLSKDNGFRIEDIKFELNIKK